MQSGDFHINVDTIKIQMGSIESSNQQQVTQEKQESTSQNDKTNKLTSFKDFCQATDIQLLEKLKAQNDEENAKHQKCTLIQRVPEVLQRNDYFKEYYKPMEFSVGPLHAANPDLFKLELKITLAARYLTENGYTAEDLFEEIKNNLQELKMAFDEREIKSYNDEILARLLFLDGCAVLQFIRSYVNQSLNEFSINNSQGYLIQQDLFLLENQIPFKVFQLLMGMKLQKSPTIENENYLMDQKIVLFILDINPMELVRPRTSLYLLDLVRGHSDSKPVLHLLDLLRSLLVMDSHDGTSHFCRNFWVSIYECVYSFFGALLVCLPLSVLCAFEKFLDYVLCVGYNWYPQQSFRNVQELAAAGIRLKPSDSCSLKDISFSKQWFLRGRVELPSLVVDDSTARKMLNLVAYEMCNDDYYLDCYVTSYIKLIDLLIDDEKDVKLLRSAEILRNRLSTDVEVATLFNRIGSTCLSPLIDTYVDLKMDIESHCKRKLALWMAQVYHAHFSSPWTILALLAAATVLLLTAIQTWYAIHPKS